MELRPSHPFRHRFTFHFPLCLLTLTKYPATQTRQNCPNHPLRASLHHFHASAFRRIQDTHAVFVADRMARPHPPAIALSEAITPRSSVCPVTVRLTPGRLTPDDAGLPVMTDDAFLMTGPVPPSARRCWAVQRTEGCRNPKLSDRAEAPRTERCSFWSAIIIRPSGHVS